MEFTYKIFLSSKKKKKFKYDENQYICMETGAQIVHNYVCIFYLFYNSSFIKGEKSLKMMDIAV